MRDVLRTLLTWLEPRRPTSVPVRPPRRQRHSSHARDFQRLRVYRWEGEAVLPHSTATLSLEQCRALVRVAYCWAEGPLADQPGWSPPVVTDGRGRRHACGSRAIIKLPRWSRTAPVVLHECAHGLSTDKHGPGFVAVYLALAEQFLALDSVALRASATTAGILVGTAVRGPDGALVASAGHQRRTPGRKPSRSRVAAKRL